MKPSRVFSGRKTSVIRIRVTDNLKYGIKDYCKWKGIGMTEFIEGAINDKINSFKDITP